MGASISGRDNFTEASGEREPGCRHATDSSCLRRTLMVKILALVAALNRKSLLCAR